MIRRENVISARAVPPLVFLLLHHTAAQHSPKNYGAAAAPTIPAYQLGKRIQMLLHSLNHRECLGVLEMFSHAYGLLLPVNLSVFKLSTSRSITVQGYSF